MSCELDKFRNEVYTIAGVGKTSVVKMKDDLLFLPSAGLGNTLQLKSPDNTYKWGEYIKNEVNKLFGNEKGIYGELIQLQNSIPGNKANGTYVFINFTPQLRRAIDYKNGLLDAQAYEQWLEYEEYMKEEEFKKESLEAEFNIIEEGIRSGKINMICNI